MHADYDDPVSISRTLGRSISRTLGSLERDYPGWRFAVKHHGDGPHVEACREFDSPGLVCVITADMPELRRELEHAA